MEQNKTSKYLKYAIGEIVLVVIGILIALSINNWNENRKNKLKLTNVLIALKSDLETDLASINHHHKFSKMVVVESNKMLARSRKESANLDTLVYLGKNKFRPSWVTPFAHNNSTFESIKYSGDFELLNDSLRSSITRLYNRQKYYSDNLETFNNEYKNRFYNFSQSYISSFTDEKTYLAKTISWQSIDKKDFAIKFDGIVSYRNELWKYYLEILEKQKNKTENVISLINYELNK